MNQSDRFWKNVNILDDCWQWTSGTDKDGYGKVYFDSKHKRAHRIAYQECIGPIYEGQQILHHCDNPGCCNPDHLFMGTNADNMADKVSKDRQFRGQRPDKHITDEMVEAIKNLYGSYTQQEIADYYGIGQSHVSRIIRGVSR